MNNFGMIAVAGTANFAGTGLAALLDNYVKIYDLGELI